MIFSLHLTEMKAFPNGRERNINYDNFINNLAERPEPN